jgi:xylulokinase
MHGSVLLDEKNEPLAPAVIWADTRSAPDATEITSVIGPARLIDITGSPVAAGFQAATLRWFQRQQPDTWRRVRRVLLPKDWLRWKLTATFATDPSDAAGTLLLDRQTRRWSNELLTALGFPADLFPDIHPSSEITGALQDAPARALGLNPGIPVISGGGDAACAAIGSGVVDPRAMLMTISTGGQVIVPAMRPEIDSSGRIHTFCSCLEPELDRAGWYQMGATMVAGLALRWLRDAIFALPAETGYDQMTAAAASVPAGAGGLIFLPYLSGERTPHLDPLARGVFLGLTADHGRGHLVRAVMEGVALALYDAYDVVRSLGAEPERVVLAGGGASSPLWRQIFADVFGLSISIGGTTSNSAAGAALLAAAAVNAIDVAETADRWSIIGEAAQPSEAAHRRYEALRPIFRSAYLTHREDFAALFRIDD